LTVRTTSPVGQDSQTKPRRSSGAPEQVEQAARLAFKGAGGLAAAGTVAGKQSHHPESREQPAQLRYLLTLTGTEVEAATETMSRT